MILMFEILTEDLKSKARVGVLSTAHGKIYTPFFMPVATKGTVKTLSPLELKDVGTHAIISNSFILYLRPGLSVVSDLHDFMKWDRIIFTDSGGFQMLNPEMFVKLSEDGITFKSPFSGKNIELTPKMSIEIQESLHSDVVMVLDDCPAYGSDETRIAESVRRTCLWAEKSKEAINNNSQLFFAIIQGGVFEKLRKKCTKDLVRLYFDGYGIGGLCIGEPKESMFQVIDYQVPLIPKEKPRYLMGVGSPIEIFECVSLGIDIFDSVFPTRNARHSSVYTHFGHLNLKKAEYFNDNTPIDPKCHCYTCNNFTKAYVAHLLREYETFGMRLATIHNVYFLHELMQKIRESIQKNTFLELKEKYKEIYSY